MDRNSKESRSRLARIGRRRLGGWNRTLPPMPHTDRRYQNDLRDCVLCTKCKGKDEIEHYLCCPYGFVSICRKLNIKPNPSQLSRVMLVKSDKQDNPVLMSLILYSIRGVVHKLRAKQYRAKPSEITAFLWEQIRVAAAHHSGLSKRLRSM